MKTRHMYVRYHVTLTTPPLRTTLDRIIMGASGVTLCWHIGQTRLVVGETLEDIFHVFILRNL